MYDYYNAAKKALSKGTSACQLANELAQQTEESLRQAIEASRQVSFLKDSLQDQLRLLHQISLQIRSEEEQYRLEFDSTIRELDVLDDELNEALNQLQKTVLPAALTAPGADPLSPDQAAESGQKSLFTFADDAAVENLKGQLRQIVDDMQTSLEACSGLHSDYGHRLTIFDQLYDSMPKVPEIRPIESPDPAGLTQQTALSVSESRDTYVKQHEEHLQQMAELLLSLSQHYDHSCTLFKSDASLAPEELAELHNVVHHDAEQLEDVLSELDERVAEIEDDLATIRNFTQSCVQTRVSAVALFGTLESFEIDALAESITNIRYTRVSTADRLDILKQQLVALSDHYYAFGTSYHALLLEIDRRAKYEASVAVFLEKTDQTLARLAADEIEKRKQFTVDHGDTLPGDIWHGITAKPATYNLNTSDMSASTPRLPSSLIAAAKAKLERRRQT